MAISKDKTKVDTCISGTSPTRIKKDIAYAISIKLIYT